jgi:hypothetical protein
MITCTWVPRLSNPIALRPSLCSVNYGGFGKRGVGAERLLIAVCVCVALAEIALVLPMDTK